MPQLGTPKKEKEQKTNKPSAEVVSAYSDEGKKRNASQHNGLSLRFRVLLISVYALLFVAAVVLIVVGEQQGWL
jgi:hypothetical protein